MEQADGKLPLLAFPTGADGGIGTDAVGKQPYLGSPFKVSQQQYS